MVNIGIDIGSTTSKCLLLEDGKRILGYALVKSGIGTDGPQEAYKTALVRSSATEREIAYMVATGYGRARWDAADAEISELTAHALGNYFLLPQVRTIIDIGGQDAKVIALDEHGKMHNFVMNDKCAAGTGRFLDVMAGILGLDVGKLGDIAAKAEKTVSISNTCTVFAESEVISQLAKGAAVPDVVAGICASVAGRVAALARRVGVKEQVCMSGGVALNKGVRRAMEQALGVPVVYSPMAQLAGALGGALFAYQKLNPKETALLLKEDDRSPLPLREDLAELPRNSYVVVKEQESMTF
ncbi:MAG: acyl-CoA dehydratase activase [Roseiarcus sp.]